LTIPLSRERDANRETTAIRLTVADVLPISVSDGASALAPPELLDAIESWRDGYTVDGFGAEAPAHLRRVLSIPISPALEVYPRC